LEEIYRLNRDQYHAHVVYVGIALHPRSPAYLREMVLPHLFWRDLLKVVGSPDVPQRMRAGALPVLRKRMERASLGEWRTFASLCPPRLFEWVLQRSDPELYAILLRNPRMTQERLMKLIHGQQMTRDLAVAIERNPRWFVRKPIRKSLIYCKKGNLSTALSALTGLTRTELDEIAASHSVHPLVRRTASKEIRKSEPEQ